MTQPDPTPEMLRFLNCFDGPCPVMAACDQMHGTDTKKIYRHPSIPKLAFEAAVNGWLRDFYQKEDVPPPDKLNKADIPSVYFFELELTASGRELCGLPPVIPLPVAATTRKTKAAKPAKPEPPSLFD